MSRFYRLSLLFFIAAALSLPAQEVLRGQVWIELESMPRWFVEDSPYPLDTQSIRRRALEEASLFFSAMIYGWSFHYDIGERARGIPEELELIPQGAIAWGDPGLFATDSEIRDTRFYLWTDFRPNDSQRRRLNIWKTGTIRSAQAIGHGPLGGPVEMSNWMLIKQAALEDAARQAIRAILRGGERNRPKAAEGFISLSDFPVYWMDAGQWAVSGRFRVDIREVIPFAAY